MFGFLKKQKSESKGDSFWDDQIMNLDLILKDIKKFENDFESSILTTSEIAEIVIKKKNLRKKIDRAMRAMRNEDQHFHLDAIKTTREFKKTHKEFKNNIKNIEKLNEKVEKIKEIVLDAQKNMVDGISVVPIDLQKEIDRLEEETGDLDKNQKKLKIELKQFEKEPKKIENQTTRREKIIKEYDEIFDDYNELSLELEQMISKYDSQIISEVDLQNNFSKFTWQDMEELTGKLFEKKGYSVEVTKDTSDFGIDVWATKDEMVLGIQVKKWNSDVGFEDVAKTLGSNLGKANKYILISATSFFTKQAWDHQSQHSTIIELWDTNRFRKELRDNFLDQS